MKEAEDVSSFGTLSAEYDLFHDHCDGCVQCARKEQLCAEGAKLLEHAVSVASQDASAATGEVASVERGQQ